MYVYIHEFEWSEGYIFFLLSYIEYFIQLYFFFTSRGDNFKKSLSLTQTHCVRYKKKKKVGQTMCSRHGNRLEYFGYIFICLTFPPPPSPQQHNITSIISIVRNSFCLVNTVFFINCDNNNNNVKNYEDWKKKIDVLAHQL